MRNLLTVGLTASLVAHVALLAVLLSAGSDEPSTGPEHLVIDVDVAPEAPAALDPPSPGPEPGPEPEPEPEPEPAAGEEAGDAGPRDAGPAAPFDAAVIARASDAGADEAGGPTAHDAGPAVASAGDGGPIGDAGPTAAGPASGTTSPADGVEADFGPFVPSGDRIAVLLRLDRLRDTPWAPRVDAILAPMPDHRSIMGSRRESITRSFDLLLISSADPSDVAATNLAARGQLAARAARDFLDHASQPVSWSVVRGGALGRRGPSALKLDRDERVYLMPFPGWVVLTTPANLGGLTAPATGELDVARAAPAEVPPWLARLQGALVQPDEGRGPIAQMSLRLERKRLDLPQIGELPGPQRVSLGLEIVAGGFTVRGTLRFRSDGAAIEFERGFLAARARLLGSPLGAALLRNVHGYHALDGLSLRRRGAAISYATSLSGADGKAMMELAADWARRFYGVQAEPAPR